MKIIVETSGAFQLLGRVRVELVPAHRPKLLAPSAFTQMYLARGMLRMLGQVADSCTDEELVEWIAAKKTVEAFVEANPPGKDEVKTTTVAIAPTPPRAKRGGGFKA